MRQIPANDFKKQYSHLKREIDRAIKEVLESGWYILGSKVSKFETELSSFIGAKHAIGVASGTDALTIAIKALGLGKGDGVIIPANVYPTSFGVASTNVTLQLADVNPDSLNITLNDIKKAVTKTTKAIIVVHLYGNPAPELLKIKKYAKDNGLFLIEDCAQAIGAEYKGKRVGTFGDIACFSFYPTKNLGAIGDGGAIVTNKRNLADKVKMFRAYGERDRYKSEFVGLNSRLDEIQAAILSAKLKHLKGWNKSRRLIAKQYLQQLRNTPIEFVKETKDSKSCYHLFVIKTASRDKLNSFLRENGVLSAVHYPTPIHQTSAFAYLGYKNGNFPVSELSSSEILSLPIYPEMTKSDVEYVTKLVKKFFKL